MTKLPQGPPSRAAARTARAAAVFFGLVLAISCGAEPPDFPHPQSIEEAMADAAARGVPILIDFYTPG